MFSDYKNKVTNNELYPALWTWQFTFNALSTRRRFQYKPKRMECHWYFYSGITDIFKYLKISLIHLQISVIQLRISVKELQLSVIELQISIILNTDICNS